jgi:UTP--glucose-1-phosphate uridylyltransferase
MLSPIRTAIIPAGGSGSRLMPLTRTVPKELLPVWKKPVLQYAIDEAAAAGIERLIIVTAPGKESLQRHINFDSMSGNVTNDSGLTIDFVVQDVARGLGDAIRLAAPRDEPVAVLLPDELLLGDNCLRQLVQSYVLHQASILAVQKVPLADVRHYGIVDVTTLDGRSLDVRAVVEKPEPHLAPSQLAIIGRYILDPAVIDVLQSAGPTLNGDIQLTDSIAATCGTSMVKAVHFDGRRFDCSDFHGLLQANLAVAEMDNPKNVGPIIDRTAA